MDEPLSLSETVWHLADRMYYNWMSGGNEYYRIDGAEIVARIFDVDSDEVYRLVEEEFSTLLYRRNTILKEKEDAYEASLKK